MADLSFFCVEVDTAIPGEVLCNVRIVVCL